MSTAYLRGKHFLCLTYLGILDERNFRNEAILLRETISMDYYDRGGGKIGNSGTC